MVIPFSQFPNPFIDKSFLIPTGHNMPFFKVKQKTVAEIFDYVTYIFGSEYSVSAVGLKQKLCEIRFLSR